MSDLREAIAVALRAELASMQDEGLIGTIDGWVVPRLVGVFEAYLREHDAQIIERMEAEHDFRMTKARQRIERVPQHQFNHERCVSLAAVLEALGGSDE